MAQKFRQLNLKQNGLVFKYLKGCADTFTKYISAFQSSLTYLYYSACKINGMNFFLLYDMNLCKSKYHIIVQLKCSYDILKIFCIKQLEKS